MKKTAILLMVMVLSAFSATDANADAELASGPPSSIETATAQGVLAAKNRTVLGITVGQHSLADVRRRLGDAKVVKMQAMDGRPDVVCYRSSKDDATVVMFEAGPLGGFKDVTAATVAPASAFGAAAHACLATEKVNRKTAAIRGIRLGAPMSSVSSVLGKAPAKTKAGLVELPLELIKEHKSSSGTKTEETVSSGFVGRADASGSLAWFSVYYTRSN
jgi:hypothetical protein